MGTVTASVAGGNWSTNGAWVGSVQPSAADDVLLTATSGNITIPASTTALCRSIVCTGYTGTLTFSATTSLLNIGDGSGGALTFVSGMTVTLTAVGTINFISTSNNGGTGWTVTTGGKTLPNVTFNGAGGKWVQGDALTSSGAVTLTSGTYGTANFAVNVSTHQLSGGTTRTWTPGSSAIAVSSNSGAAFDLQTVTNLTVTANTAIVTMNGGSGAGFRGGAISLNGLSVVFAATSANSSNQTLNLNGSTVVNVTKTSGAVKTENLSVGGDGTITGTLTLTGNSTTNRILLLSSTIGTTRTLTLSAAPALTNVDFTDITVAGAAAPVSGTSLGDALGNSGITFPASVVRYGVVAGNFSATATWSATSGGSGGASVPLPHDDVVLDASSAAGTYTRDMPRLGRSLTCTGFTRTLGSTLQHTIYGAVTFATGMTISGSVATLLSGRGSHTLTSAGKAQTGNITVQGPGGTYTLADALDLGSNVLTVNNGTLDTSSSNYSVSSSTLVSTGTPTRGITLNSSTVSLSATSGTPLSLASTGLTLSAASATIVFTAASSSSRTFAGGGLSFGTLTYTVAASTGALVVTGANTFGTLNVSGGVRTLTLPASTTTTVTVSWAGIVGTAGNLVTVNSSTAGTAATLSMASGALSSDYLSIQDITGTGGATFYVGSHSTNVSGNTGLVFSGPSLIYADRAIRRNTLIRR